MEDRDSMEPLPVDSVLATTILSAVLLASNQELSPQVAAQKEVARDSATMLRIIWMRKILENLASLQKR